ncbi:class I SAM-dependent methyltransferase [Clostridium botulinum]|nr:class I SAM-dependent methyltransferase [Clostridium botulinum]NFS95622.1 class I SAM-dependent methyltransferase [Clostridium botulinum]
MKTFDEKWEQIHSEMEWGRYPSEEVIRFVARNYYNRNRKNIRILDFGCGTGAVTWYLAREGFDAYGFDGSETAINKAKIRIKEENVSADLRVADAGMLPYNDGSFDSVIDSAVIYANNVSQISHILKQIYRVLKCGGKIFSTGLFNEETTGFGTGEKIENNTYRQLSKGCLANRGTVHFLTIDEIYKLWKMAGFKNIKIDGVRRTDSGREDIVSFYIVEAEK